MAKASDNKFPKLILEERLSDGSDTSNPAADHRALFLGEDGLLHLRDSAGTVTDVGVSGSGVGAGTSFPGSGGDLFMRTDLDILFQYDGTRWRCVCPHTVPLHLWNQTNVGSSATSGGTLRGAIPPRLGSSDLWLLSTVLEFYVNGGTALDVSHNWVVTMSKVDASAGDTTIATHTISSGASSAYRADTQAINALLGATYFIFQTNVTKSGTPGNLLHYATLTYQYVAT